jgi:hypothetical protein
MALPTYVTPPPLVTLAALIVSQGQDEDKVTLLNVNKFIVKWRQQYTGIVFGRLTTINTFGMYDK